MTGMKYQMNALSIKKKSTILWYSKKEEQSDLHSSLHNANHLQLTPSTIRPSQ